MTAGTVFHQVRSPMWKWFWAIYQLARDKKGVAALVLAKQIGVRYRTAWLMLHKLRRAMRRSNQALLLQGLLEVDETDVAGEAEGQPGRGAENKTPVAIAVELIGGKSGRVASEQFSTGVRRPRRAIIIVLPPSDCDGKDHGCRSPGQCDPVASCVQL